MSLLVPAWQVSGRSKRSVRWMQMARSYWSAMIRTVIIPVPGLAYYLTGELHDKALFPRTSDDYRKLKFKYAKERVTRIDRDSHMLELSSQKTVPYDRLLLAVGARAARLKTPGAELEGVLKLDHMEDAKRILKFARRGKTAVVIGGGITALELVEGLIARGVKVHYLLRGDRYWSNVLDEHEIKDR